MRLTRAFAAATNEIRKFGPRLWRIARELFHEVTGFIFLALALFFTLGRQGLIRAYQDLGAQPDGLARFLLVGAFVLLFGAFGVSSFRRARRISRNR